MRFVFVILLGTAVGAFAFSPQLSRVEPRGGQRGHEVWLELIGARLYEPEDILFYRQGLEVIGFEKKENGKKVIAHVRISPDAPLGEHPLRLRCRGGLTHMRTFWVGQYPTIRETYTKDGKREANNSPQQPQKIRMNVTVQGVIQREDADYFLVDCKKGQRLSAEVEGMRLGRVMFDPRLAIIGPDGDELAVDDDSLLLGRDCAVSIICPVDGHYLVVLRESAFEGSSQAQYRLHVGHFPRPTRVSPWVASPDQARTFTFLGDPTGPIRVEQSPSPILPLSHNGYEMPSGIPILLSDLKVITEQEPNLGAAQAFPKENPPAIETNPIAFHGVLTGERDVDWFRFRAKKGQRLRAQVIARDYGSPIDSVLVIRSAKPNKVIGQNDDATGGTPDSRVTFKVPHDGEYYLIIRDQLHRTGASFQYRVELGPVPRSLSAALPTSDRNDDQKYKVVNVPRGSHLALVPNLARSELSCAVQLISPALPTGLSVRTQPIPKQLNNFPILFTAAPDAALSGMLATFQVKDPASGLTGPLEEKIAHVKINNLGTYHATEHNQIALAVIEKAPFTLHVDSPTAPIVPGGRLDLKVCVTRDEGFDPPIRLKIPWRPPGVTAPNEIEIPKGKNEATITLNAKKETKASDWHFVVTAAGSGKRGEVRLSSDFLPLSIQSHWVEFSLNMPAGPAGSMIEMIGTVKHLKPFDGEATITLHALPHGATAKPVTFISADTEIRIPITLSSDIRRGKHRKIFAEVAIPTPGGAVIHQVAHDSSLRVTPPSTTAKK